MQNKEINRKQLFKIMTDCIRENGTKPEDIFEVVDYGEEVDRNLDAVDTLMISNLFKPLNDGKCYFIEGNTAFITIAEESGDFMYITQNANGERTAVTILHFFAAFAGGYFAPGVSLMLKTFGFRSREEETLRNFRNKYQYNLETLKNGVLLKRNHFVLKTIYPLFPVLELLNFLGSVNAIREEQIINDEHLFFSSIGHVSNMMEIYKPEDAKGITTTAKILSMLALLGFIEKANEEELPEEIKPRVKKERSITFYTIRELNAKTIRNAEEKVLQIEAKSIELGVGPLTISNITRNRIRIFFGETEADRVYPNDATKRRNAINKRIEKNYIIRCANDNDTETDVKFE